MICFCRLFEEFEDSGSLMISRTWDLHILAFRELMYSQTLTGQIEFVPTFPCNIIRIYEMVGVAS